MVFGQNSFKLVWRYDQLLSRLLDNGHLLRVSRQSRLFTSNMDDEETIPEAVHRSSGIYLTAEESRGKLQIGDDMMKTA